MTTNGNMNNIVTSSVTTSPSRRMAHSVAGSLLLVLAAGMTGCKQSHNADVVATVNGHAIMRAEMDKMYKEQLGDAQHQQEPTPEQADSLRLGVLKDLVDEEIVQQRAAKMNLTATPEEVDAKLAEMKAPYSEEQFQQRLQASNHTLDEVKRDLRRTLTINKLLNKEINSKITVSDADITGYYNAHKSEFNNIETQYHLAQILVTSSPAANPGNLQGNKATNDAEAKKKIQALRNRVDSGEDFGSLAMNFSENPQTSSSGGDMGSISESQLRSNPEVFNAVSKLKVGQVTDIMPFPDPSDPKKPGGYAIFQLIGREPAGQHSVSEPQIQQRIRQGLRDARSQLLKGAYFEMLRDQSKVENFFAEQIFKNGAH
ncbi:peptidylprolyl isomerase [Granulicella sp. WH15]|nr:peptidylprolyl isomerase [Granulicella sp. WH15]